MHNTSLSRGSFYLEAGEEAITTTLSLLTGGFQRIGVCLSGIHFCDVRIGRQLGGVGLRLRKHRHSADECGVIAGKANPTNDHLLMERLEAKYISRIHDSLYSTESYI